jgi:hypothetical protein
MTDRVFFVRFPHAIPAVGGGAGAQATSVTPTRLVAVSVPWAVPR